MDKLIADIAKTKKEIVRVTLDEFKDTDTFNVRIWTKSHGKLLPTTKGSRGLWLIVLG